jgi:advillin
MHKLFEIKETNNQVSCTEIKERPMKREMLKSDNVYILETFRQVDIWIGKDADLAEKKNSLAIGKGFVQAHEKPKGTRVYRIVEGTENQLFKSYFDNFVKPLELGADDNTNDKIAAVAEKKRIISDNLLSQLGKYTTKVYLCKTIDGE